jgi:hypothetical protein
MFEIIPLKRFRKLQCVCKWSGESEHREVAEREGNDPLEDACELGAEAKLLSEYLDAKLA